MSKRMAGILLFCLALGGCYLDDGGPATPNADLAGSWSGTAADVNAGAGSLTLVLEQAGPSSGTARYAATTLAPDELAGSWAMAFAADDRAGDLTGAVAGASVYLQLDAPAPGDCDFEGTATFAAGNLAGSYLSYDPGCAGGTFEVARP